MCQQVPISNLVGYFMGLIGWGGKYDNYLSIQVRSKNELYSSIIGFLEGLSI